MMLCGWGVKAAIILWINVWVQQVKLRDPSLICAAPERIGDEPYSE